MTEKRRPASTLRIEALETREMLSASPALPTVVVAKETFDQTSVGNLPPGWAQWDSQATFEVLAGRSLKGAAGLVASGSSGEMARAWLGTVQPADLRVNSTLLLDSLIPAEMLVRGQGLNTTSPTYYSLSLSRGLDLGLWRVVNGERSYLGSLRSADYFSGQWVRVALEADGTTLRAQVMRLDTGQYLDGSGHWGKKPTFALVVHDKTITGPGYVGLARQAGYAGDSVFDSFQVSGLARDGRAPSPYFQQRFNGTPSGALPVGWAQWSNQAPAAVGPDPSSRGPKTLRFDAGSSNNARAWFGQDLPADVRVTSEVLLDSLIPAELIARGNALGSATPTYYAAALTRGLDVELWRVVNGTRTSLGRVRSADYLSGQWVRVSLEASGQTLRVGVSRLDTGLYLNSSGHWQARPTWALVRDDGAISSGGKVGLGRASSYAGVSTFDKFEAAVLGKQPAPPPVTPPPLPPPPPSPPPTPPPPPIQGTPPPSPAIPRHYSHIRLAELAYFGLNLGPLETKLLRDSVDLVVPDTAYLGNINAVAPHTPQLIYTNASSIYQDSLVDWLAYADAHGISRESAFYHVAHALRFDGRSPSSQPVNWFWGVYLGETPRGLLNFTGAARDRSGGVHFGKEGESLYLGYTDRFREINFDLAHGAGSHWSGVLEYATSVDAAGHPTGWAPLRLLNDGTSGFHHSGQITFDPPSNWRPGVVGGTARLYYVRIRTLTAGNAPLANTILGRDYVGAGGGHAGVIPAFDAAADVDHDGYLNDNEYAHRAPGKDARFLYESRVFLGFYGQMRPATNPSDAAFRAWVVDYHLRFLHTHALADGLFVDNSGGKPPVANGDVLESTASYTNDYATMLRALANAAAPRWVMVNTSNGGGSTDTIVGRTGAYYEEFALRPLVHNYQQFEDLAAYIARRQHLNGSNPPFAVLDSIPTGGSPTEPRTQLATLAYYYLLADPVHTFLDFYGGFEPSTQWMRHWTAAAAYNVGQPLGNWSLFASGRDPADHRLMYHIYQRNYSNALVLFRPLSYSSTVSSKASLADASATTHLLHGTYRPLRADGTLGAAVTSVTLRNGEGAILIKS
jgi:hypothetical protein